MIFGIISIIIVVTLTGYIFVNIYLSFSGVAPFVPTPMRAVHKILKNAKIKKGDILYDLGAGDGRFLHFAEKDYGAKATGFEIDPGVFLYAKMKQWLLGWKGKMVRSKFQKQNINDADIIVCYMLPRTLKPLEKFFQKQIKNGTKVISYAFSIGDLKPKKIIPRDKAKRISKILIYEK